MVTGDVIITSKNPPARILSKKAGKLSVLNFSQGDSIEPGVIIAIIENSASEDDVASLKTKLSGEASSISSIEFLNKKFPPQLNLGTSIQPAYTSFLRSYQKLILNTSYNEDLITQAQLSKQLHTQNRSISNKEQQLTVLQNTIAIRGKNLNRHRQLLSKGVISQLDLEQVENEYLYEKQQFHVLEQELFQMETEKNAILKAQLLTNSSGIKKENFQEAEVILAQQELLNKIIEWEEENLLKSPVAGVLSFNDVWGEFQNVSEGEVVFTVMPFDRQDLIGKCIVPVKNSGKIHKGQLVFLKMDNYPYREWGIIKANVKSISGISESGNIPGYIIYLEVKDLTTTYGRELIFNQELLGTAEILLEETTLIERIFYQLRNLWQNH